MTTCSGDVMHVTVPGRIGPVAAAVCWHGNSMGMGSSLEWRRAGYCDPSPPESGPHSIPSC